MRIIRISMLVVMFAAVLSFVGCDGDLMTQNRIQREKIEKLNSDLAAEKVKADQLARELADGNSVKDVEIQTLTDKVGALEQHITKKNDMVSMMQQQLTFGGMFIPPELATALEEFASNNPAVTYDPNRGMVKFQSDLVFTSGSDEVAAGAQDAIAALCAILNSEAGKKFDVVIAGHTDDVPIGKPATRAKHPTNWHLSVHRGIAVLNIMTANQVEPERVSVRGFGEYRPIMPNSPDKKGNPKNRRVEIYIVPKGI